MARFSCAAIVCLLLAACADTGAPKPGVVVRGVDSGMRQVIDDFYSVAPDCSNAGYPEVHIVKAPQHGALSVDNGEAYPSFPKDNVRYDCNKKKVATVQVSYASAGGFRGKDAVTIEVRYANSSIRLVTYNIDVL